MIFEFRVRVSIALLFIIPIQVKQEANKVTAQTNLLNMDYPGNRFGPVPKLMAIGRMRF